MSAAENSANRAKPIAVYALAAVGFLFFGVMSHDFPPFGYACIAVAVLCLVQMHYQFFGVWLGILLLYVAGSVLYGWLLFADLVKLVQGKRTTMLLDFDDSLIFVAFVALLIGVTAWLFRARPSRHQNVSDV